LLFLALVNASKKTPRLRPKPLTSSRRFPTFKQPYTITAWKEGEIFVFDDTYEHEVWNDTDEERVILLFDFDRPMKFWGRFLNTAFLNIMKLTAFYQDPKKNLQSAEERLEAAIRKADANMEAMSDPAGA